MDSLRSRLKELEDALGELESFRRQTFAELEGRRRERWALRYGMLAAIQIVIDVACAVVSHENLGPPRATPSACASWAAKDASMKRWPGAWRALWACATC